MKIVLVDATNLVMRAASAVCRADPDASPDQQAEVDSTCFGMMEKVCRATGASHLILAWDSPFSESERRKLYPGYKSGRTGKTAYWIQRVRPQFADAEWCCLSVSGWEADDIIATLTRRLADRGIRPVILSTDSDLLALVDEADVYQFAKPTEPEWVVLRTPAYVVEKYGVPPAHLTALKALAGEPGDDMPGPFGKHCIVRARQLLVGAGALDVFAEDGTDPIEVLIEKTMLVGDFADKARLARDVLRLRDDLPLPPIMPSACRVPGSY
jgi:DNA polymerase-1